jgi:hypothetical protein
MGERHGSYPSFTTVGRVIGDFQFSELGEIPGRSGTSGISSFNRAKPFAAHPTHRYVGRKLQDSFEKTGIPTDSPL